MVDLEHREAPEQIGPPPGQGVEACPEGHILGEGAGGEAVLGVAGTARDRRARLALQVLGEESVGQGLELLQARPDEEHGERIVEHPGEVVANAVLVSTHSRQHRRPAR